jgi:hypothetical protein
MIAILLTLFSSGAAAIPFRTFTQSLASRAQHDIDVQKHMLAETLVKNRFFRHLPNLVRADQAIVVCMSHRQAASEGLP